MMQESIKMLCIFDRICQNIMMHTYLIKNVRVQISYFPPGLSIYTVSLVYVETGKFLIHTDKCIFSVSVIITTRPWR